MASCFMVVPVATLREVPVMVVTARALVSNHWTALAEPVVLYLILVMVARAAQFQSAYLMVQLMFNPPVPTPHLTLL
jgi:hypothetical protein